MERSAKASLGQRARAVAMPVMLVLLLLNAPAAGANPDIITNSPTTDSGEWISGPNAYSSNNSYATTGDKTSSHTYYNYGFSLAGYSITKVEVGVEGYGDGDDSLDIQCSWDGGTNWTNAYKYVPPTSDPGTPVYTDLTDGRSWTLDELSNANFRVRFTKVNSTKGNEMFIDWVPVRVTYEVPAQWGLIETWTGIVSAPAGWQVIETWTGTVSAPAAWQVIETWIGAVEAPVVWQLIETWAGTVSAPAAWSLIESWTGTVSAPAAWQLVETWTGTVQAPVGWNLIESWTGTIQAPAAWQVIETWTGTVSASAEWQLIESWTGTIEAFAEWQVIESWMGTVQAPVGWQLIEMWTGTVQAPTEWQVIETWTGTVSAPAEWKLIESWTGTVSTPAAWKLIETWTGTVEAPVAWQVIETWTGTVEAPVAWQLIETWTGIVSAPVAWQVIETWIGTVEAPVAWQLIETWTGTVEASAAWQLVETWAGTVEAPVAWQLIETWTGTVSAPAEWQVIETWTGTVETPAAWQVVETWTGTVSAPAAWQVIETWIGTVEAPVVWQLIETWTGTVQAPAAWQVLETWTGTVNAPAQWNIIETWTGAVIAPAGWQITETWTGTVAVPPPPPSPTPPLPPTPPPTATIDIPSITPETPVSVEVENVAITELEINVLNTVENVRITIQESVDMPTEIAIAAPGITYRYLDIVKANITDDNISSVTITFKVEKSWIAAENIDPATIALRRWDSVNEEWVSLPTTRVGADDTYYYYSAESPGLSIFAVSGSTLFPTPAEFELSNLVIDPSEVGPGETVTISIVVTNIGELEGACTVMLKIDNVVEATEDVTLAGGATETVTFSVSRDVEGTYNVEVDGLTGTFVVTPPPAPPSIVPLAITITGIALLAGILIWLRKRRIGILPG